MFRICNVASILSRNVRPVAYYPQKNLLVTKHLFYNPGLSFTQSIRHYSKKWDDEDTDCRKTECKPKEKKECKPPPICPKRQLPHLQECAKPNLMSDCPQPACPHEEKKDNKSVILLALLALAATLGALYYFLSQKSDKDSGLLSTNQPTKRLKRPAKIYKIPENSKDIPSEVPYLLIGGGTAAFAAFRAIKSNDPTAQVLVISNEEHFPYMRPPLSKEMWFSDDPDTYKTLNFTQWNGTQRSLYYEPSDFYVNTKDLMVGPNGGVSVARGWNVSHLDVINRKAFLDDGHEINYTKCLIATGSLPKSLDVFENAPKAVLDRTALFRTVFDYQCIADRIQDAQSVAVVGGGFLGSELACAFARRTKKDEQFKVYQIFKEGGHMGSVLPEYLSFWTTEKIKSEGVDVIPNSEVVSATGGDNCVQLSLSGGKKINADLVIVAVGAIPNTEIAAKSGLETDPDFGGFQVNTELQARSHVYVAGDAACFYDPSLGRRRIEHHDNAVISGRLAGENMTGAAKPYIHQSMFWSDLGPDIGYEAIGIVHSSLPTVGVFAKTSTQETLQETLEEEVPENCMKYMSKEDEEKAKANKSKNEDIKQQAEERRKKASARPGEDFSKGVIFYMRDDIIVGIVLWNVFNRISVARQVLKDQRKYEDLNEVAKLFSIHEE